MAGKTKVPKKTSKGKDDHINEVLARRNKALANPIKAIREANKEINEPKKAPKRLDRAVSEQGFAPLAFAKGGKVKPLSKKEQSKLRGVGLGRLETLHESPEGVTISKTKTTSKPTATGVLGDTGNIKTKQRKITQSPEGEITRTKIIQKSRAGKTTERKKVSPKPQGLAKGGLAKKGGRKRYTTGGLATDEIDTSLLTAEELAIFNQQPTAESKRVFFDRTTKGRSIEGQVPERATPEGAPLAGRPVAEPVVEQPVLEPSQLSGATTSAASTVGGPLIGTAIGAAKSQTADLREEAFQVDEKGNVKDTAKLKRSLAATAFNDPTEIIKIRKEARDSGGKFDLTGNSVIRSLEKKAKKGLRDQAQAQDLARQGFIDESVSAQAGGRPDQIEDFGPAERALAARRATAVGLKEADEEFLRKGGKVSGLGNKVHRPGKVDGGLIDGKGGVDNVNAEVKEDDFIVTKEFVDDNPRVAKGLMKTIGADKKAPLHEGDVPVKVSKGEILVPSNKTALADKFLRKRGFSGGLNDTAPEAETPIEAGGSFQKGTTRSNEDFQENIDFSKSLLENPKLSDAERGRIEEDIRSFEEQVASNIERDRVLRETDEEIRTELGTQRVKKERAERGEIEAQSSSPLANKRVTGGNALAAAQIGIGVAGLAAQGKAPKDEIGEDFEQAAKSLMSVSINPALVAAHQEAQEAARFGLSPLALAQAETDIENIRRGNVGAIVNLAGGNSAAALGNITKAGREAARQNIDLSIKDEQLKQQKKQQANALAFNIETARDRNRRLRFSGAQALEARQQQIFAGDVARYDRNQSALGGLLQAGISNAFTEDQLTRREGRADRRAEQFGGTTINLTA